MTGDRAVRAAHSLAADPLVEEVVVVGPAKSRSFKVVDNPNGCDVLVGSGPSAPDQARGFDLPLIWDGDRPTKGVAVWGASAAGLAIAMSKRESKVSTIAYAHPNAPGGANRSVRFAKPVGAVHVDELSVDGRTIWRGKSYNEYAGCLVVSRARSVTIIDKADFLSGVALAAGITGIGSDPRPAWEASLLYLETATQMGLVIAINP